jgi:hypothetical protein
MTQQPLGQTRLNKTVWAEFSTIDGCMYVLRPTAFLTAKRTRLKLKTWTKQFQRYLPLAIVISALIWRHDIQQNDT